MRGRVNTEGDFCLALARVKSQALRERNREGRAVLLVRYEPISVRMVQSLGVRSPKPSHARQCHSNNI